MGLSARLARLCPPLAQWQRRRFFRDTLRKARAWRLLQDKHRDLEHYHLFQDIPFGVDLALPRSALFGLVPPEYRDDAITCLRQRMYLPTRDSGLWAELICHLAGASQPLALPAPKPWRQALEARGVRVSGWRSQLGFFLQQAIAFKEGLGALRRLLRQHKGDFGEDGRNPYVLFVGMRDNYLPLKGNRSDTRWDLVSWYRRSSLNDPKFQEIWVTSFEDLTKSDMTGIRRVMQPLPSVPRAQWPGLLFSSVAMTAWALVRWLCGAWWAPFLLSNAIQLNACRRVPAERLPAQAIFNSTQKIVRPLWTYDAERRGSRVMIVLYSKNVSVFIPERPEVPGTAPDFAQVSWPEYIIWDDDHQTELTTTGVNPSARFTKVGPIGLADSAQDFPALPHPCVAVFDVDGMAISHSARIGFSRPYWDHKNSLAFVEQCFKNIRAVGAIPVYKPKGFSNGVLLRPQAHMFFELVKRYDAILMDGLINANRVISATDASLSMPFTSTAASGIYLDRPAAYFDPTNSLHHHTHLAGEVPVLFDEASLQNWLRDTLSRPRP